MGAGIAQVSIDKGYHVIMKDNMMPGLARGQDQIYKGLDGAAKKKKITTLVSYITSATILIPKSQTEAFCLCRRFYIMLSIIQSYQ